MTTRPNLVIANFEGVRLFDDTDLALLGSVGDVLDPEPLGRWDDPRADDLLSRADVIVGHWGCPPIDAALLDRAPRLGLIAYAGGTVRETIAPEVLGRVRVTSCADANAEPVAEYTLAMILLANKDVLWQRDVERDRSLAAVRSASEIPVGNWDKTIGIVGASMVGRRVIELLRPFPELSPLLYDPFVSDDEAQALGVEKVDLLDLCARADVVSIHAPDLPSTHHMIGERQIAAMRTGTTLINTARGRLLDHEALTRHANRLVCVLDVTDPEPLPDDHPLRSAPTVTLTPHLAGSQGTELRRLAEYATDEIRRFVAGEPGRNVVTAARIDRIA
ncbi:MAG: hydroxyacid dehydrogenase [Microthrixaceae bacterium]|nr:hydroxyacid dehydrogenase [Microthrixaceae bacterium]